MCRFSGCRFNLYFRAGYEKREIFLKENCYLVQLFCFEYIFIDFMGIGSGAVPAAKQWGGQANGISDE